ncbi:MAG: efflux RND transporter permease subunit [Melioribacter sp.]|nr:efflux RND transporter permease subunit [Melioribacter sp.]
MKRRFFDCFPIIINKQKTLTILQISTFSIRRPVTVAMFFIGIALVGIFAFLWLGIDLFSSVSIPYLLIPVVLIYSI